MDRTSLVSSARLARLTLLAMLALAMTGAAWGASDFNDENDPFDEWQRFERFDRLGGKLAEEQDVELRFTFSDRYETRARYAQVFANKLKRMGYPKATAQPCAHEESCWQVTAPKRMRLDLKKSIALGQQLDQLAADDYGRYDGWDCALFKEEDELFIAPAPVGPNKEPTIDAWLTQQDKLAAFQCEKLRTSLAAKENGATNWRDTVEMICTCVPQRQQELRLAVQQELNTPMTEVDFREKHLIPKVLQPCGAESIRRDYGEQCPARVAGVFPNPENYCRCMRPVVNSLSDADLTDIMINSPGYQTQEELARKHGTRPPDPPAIYKEFMAREAACMK